MKRRCQKCGMIRAVKDLVSLEEDVYICFSCWNKKLKHRKEKSSSKLI